MNKQKTLQEHLVELLKGGQAHVDFDGAVRSDRSAARIYGPERYGADGTQRESVFRTCVRVPWAARRSDQTLVVVGRLSVSFCEKTGARKIHLAARDERNGGAESRTIIHAAGRDRPC